MQLDISQKRLVGSTNKSGSQRHEEVEAEIVQVNARTIVQF